MATFTQLAGWNVNAVKGTEVDEKGAETTAVETWTLVFQEHGTGDRILFAMRREARDELVRQLTGGLVLAGGDLPKL